MARRLSNWIVGVALLATVGGVAIGATSQSSSSVPKIDIGPRFGFVPTVSDVAAAIGVCAKVASVSPADRRLAFLRDAGWIELNGAANPNPRQLTSYVAYSKGAIQLHRSEFDAQASCTLFFASPASKDLDGFLADLEGALGAKMRSDRKDEFGPQTLGLMAQGDVNILVQLKPLDDRSILVLTVVQRMHDT